MNNPEKKRKSTLKNRFHKKKDTGYTELQNIKTNLLLTSFFLQQTSEFSVWEKYGINVLKYTKIKVERKPSWNNK